MEVVLHAALRFRFICLVITLFFGCSENTSRDRTRVDGGTDAGLLDANNDPIDSGTDDQMFAGDTSEPQDMMWAPTDAGGGAPDTNTPTATYAVTVTGGYGGGQYQVGETVHVFAANNPFNEVVTGRRKMGLMRRPKQNGIYASSSRNDVMPSPQIQVNNLDAATYRRRDRGQQAHLYHHPRERKGASLHLSWHGRQREYYRETAARYLAMAAALRGYAVIVPEAKEVTDGDQNGDRRFDGMSRLCGYERGPPRHCRLFDDDDRRSLPADGPRVALGMSNGGAFSVTVGAALPQFEAVVSFCATGVSAVSKEHNAHGLVHAETIIMRPFQHPARDGPMAPWRLRRMVRTVFDIHPPSPVYAGRLPHRRRQR